MKHYTFPFSYHQLTYLVFTFTNKQDFLCFMFQTRQMIEKGALVALGLTRNEVDDWYEKLGDDEKVISILQHQAAEKNMDFSLKKNVDTLQYELKCAAKAHKDWQPYKVYCLYISSFYH